MPLVYYPEAEKGDPGPQGPQGPAGASGFIPLYGGFQDTTTQDNTTPGGANVMTFNTVDFPDGVELSVGGDAIVFPTPGLYNMQWSGQFAKTGNSNADTYVWLKQNGVNIVGSAGRVTIQNRGIIGWNYFIQTATANETLQIMWSSDEATMKITQYPANGIHPSTASVVVTVTQVA